MPQDQNTVFSFPADTGNAYRASEAEIDGSAQDPASAALNHDLLDLDEAALDATQEQLDTSINLSQEERQAFQSQIDDRRAVSFDDTLQQVETKPFGVSEEKLAELANTFKVTTAGGRQAEKKKLVPSLFLPTTVRAATLAAHVPVTERREDGTKKQDGIDFIQIADGYATTELGKQLGLNAHVPFTHQDSGKFASIGGYIYYLESAKINQMFGISGHEEAFRTTYGSKNGSTMAKMLTRLNITDKRTIPKITDKHIIVGGAIYIQIATTPKLYEMFRESTLYFMDFKVEGEDGAERMSGKAWWHLTLLHAIRDAFKDQVANDNPNIWPDFSTLTDEAVQAENKRKHTATALTRPQYNDRGNGGGNFRNDDKPRNAWKNKPRG